MQGPNQTPDPTKHRCAEHKVEQTDNPSVWVVFTECYYGRKHVKDCYQQERNSRQYQYGGVVRGVVILSSERRCRNQGNACACNCRE